MNRSELGRHRVVIASAVLIIVIAVLAFVAALANAFDWEGWWVAFVAAVLAALALAWRLWNDVVKPARERKVADEVERRHATAVVIDLSPDDEGVGVSLRNRGTHEVRRIEILGTPVGGQSDPMLLGPPFQSIEHSSSSGVAHIPMPGGDVRFKIEHLTPGRGPTLGTYRDLAHSPTNIRFEVNWFDHEGKYRGAVGVADFSQRDHVEVQMEPASEDDNVPVAVDPGENVVIKIFPPSKEKP